MKFETQFTRDFISRSLPSGARRVLEIGCGSGELAASLLRDGVCLIAIDSDADSIAAAQTLGVDARIAAWPTTAFAATTPSASIGYAIGARMRAGIGRGEACAWGARGAGQVRGSRS